MSPISAPFSSVATQYAPVTLKPGQSVMVPVFYSPKNAGPHTATVKIPNSGAGSPLVLTLTGKTVSSQSDVAYRVNAGGPR
jgi:hypothetical protein